MYVVETVIKNGVTSPECHAYLRYKNSNDVQGMFTNKSDTEDRYIDIFDTYIEAEDFFNDCVESGDCDGYRNFIEEEEEQ